jgi:hypothetical protein
MKAFARFLFVLNLTAFCAACGGGGAASPPPPAAPAAPSVNVDAGLKQLIFSWAAVSGATHYKLFENPDGQSGFTQTGADIAGGTLSVTLQIPVHLQDFVNALYFVQACNSVGCTGSTDISAINIMLSTIGYFKASNTGVLDGLGAAVALSADGTTLAVGAADEESNATGIGGDQNDDSAFRAGAVYVFRFDGTDWFQQAYIKSSNTGLFDGFGEAVALSADGNTLAVGAEGEDSNATGINGDQNNDLASFSGAVYVFRSDGTDWIQQAYVKASNTGAFDGFGTTVALSADGNTLVAGAWAERSNATGINGDQTNDGTPISGAAYVFRFDGTDWFQQAYIKSSNTGIEDSFGDAIALSADGNTLAVGAWREDSTATGVDGDQNDNFASDSGAVYVFRFDGTDWSQQAYVKASNTARIDSFGIAIALSADGNTLAVGAYREDSNATGVGGDQTNDLTAFSGAVYVFRFDGTDWSQQAYIKASNTGGTDLFGAAVALSADGNTLAVGAYGEDSNATGVGGDQNDNLVSNSGAVYVFRFDGTNWSQQAYVKASNTGTDDEYGGAVALSADGNTLAVGALGEDSNATGIGGDQNDDSANDSGAVYLF